VRRRAVEAQRVALAELMDGAGDLDLDGPARDVDEHLAGARVRGGRPAAAARGPLAHERRAGRGGQLAHGCAVRLDGLALVAPDDLRLLRARRRPQLADRHVQRAGDRLHGVHAGPRQPTLDLAQERVRQPRALAERLERQPALAPQRPHLRTQPASTVL
jgi:hypothetical protein